MTYMARVGGVLLLVATAHAQDPVRESDLVRLSLDCSDCDRDYVQSEIAFVEFVRERFDADVHLYVTSERTGAGGRRYTFHFAGRDRFQGMADTLEYTAGPADSDDRTRAGQVEVMKRGLVRFAARTQAAERLGISYATPPAAEATRRDPWNRWVFRLGGNGWFNGQKSTRSSSFNGNVSARRITEDWIVRFSASYHQSENEFKVGALDVLSISRSKRAGAFVAMSLGPRWSLALEGSASGSTFNNRRLEADLVPQIEHNLFPYRESTRRELRLTYSVGARYVDYEKETIFNRTEEWLSGQALEITLGVVQPWGSVETSLEGSHHFHDFSKFRLDWYNNWSLNLVAGLSLSLNGGLAYIRDQISLPKGDASDEEVLLRRRELETNYTYWASVGLSYSFGSIYSDVVNSRFGN